ncbi:MAG: co-chaperone GroES [Leptospiraceae bacterium]|nr:co-chaperone GroES [Leptospiraceae bacterium]
MMAIKPLADRVLIEAAPEKEEKIGSIFIPDTAKEKPNVGVVVAAGPGKVTDDGKTVPLQVKAGQKVLYGKYSGTEIKENGKEYLIVRESDILAIVE